ncbi:ABC transporter permease [Mesorhizobium sp. M7A.F.Ca.US.014.04.1.1]|uniref:Binding-protein-dependent transport systems inner membrane component n=5 Tax=Mesorhizobium TaxID=68287 RepID=E8T8P2_MESCW|nr:MULTISPECIES: ABC transporter permease [Mesorhizobium]RUZ85713.1 ABC transporter permease [Mesorhizobium sp. M7A.F.Ca.US.003.02.2.1]ADV11814.1 binding-protein-dependent transport systems inner membrane component [Mesorhizobium ciceri biovar biserrulae WSM1271]AMX94161.1 peptide ABC transporter permease [Mesorhizobium ciceri]MBZ9719512.1 ABC transporter permease [Mesorhizobium sp. AD1-1]MBZ9890630.1 ABC transporter permease [Mesorhizobium sp. BR1-1-3]
MTDLAEFPALQRAVAGFSAVRRIRSAFAGLPPSVVVGLLLLLFWVACAIAGNLFVPYDPYAEDFLATLTPPDALHWFGTDQLGRDVLSRIIVGSRDILLVAPLATLAGVAAGSIIGLVLGYFEGLTDAIGARLLDTLMAFPFIVLVTMTLVAIGPSNLTVILVIGIAYAPLVARTVRAAVREQKQRDYVSAARLGGEGPLAIMFLEILPNIRETILIELVTRLGYAFFSIATLSFLGLGIQPPSADWGLAVADGYGFLTGGKWWVVVFNSGAIVSLVMATNLIAQGIGAFENSDA